MLLVALYITVQHPVEGFFLRYSEHVTPTIYTDNLEVPVVSKCQCDGIVADKFKSMQLNTVTTAAPSQKFPLAVPMFSSYGWGPQG